MGLINFASEGVSSMNVEDLLLVGALAVIAQDLSLARRMVKFSNSYVFEEGELMENLKLPAADLRRLIYKMQDYNLVSQIAVKEGDEGVKRVYWRLNRETAKSFLMKKLEELKSIIERRRQEEEVNEYYVCAADPTHIRISFDEAVSKLSDEGMTCPVCGAMLEPQPRSRVLEILDELTEVVTKALNVLKGLEFA